MGSRSPTDAAASAASSAATRCSSASIRSVEPLRPRRIRSAFRILAAVEAARLPYAVQYTITGYPQVLETGVPPAARIAMR